MIVIKNKRELELMKAAGKISAEALARGGEAVRAGVTTKEINAVIHKYILSQNATPSFLGYGGFPASACISVNQEVIHGIPGKRQLKDGDIVSIDVGAFYGGYHGDNAATFIVGSVSPEVEQLLRVTEESLYKGIEAAIKGGRVGDVSNAVETHVSQYGYGIVKRYIGHGVGKKLHEEPEVPNYGPAGRGPRLMPGMTIAIEPMINLGTGGVRVLADDWTVVTDDGKPSAHFEHTIAITENEPIILTKA